MPNTKFIVSGSNDKIIKIWNYEVGQCIKTLKGHDGGVCLMTYITNSQLIASSSRDKTIKVWNYESNQCLKTLKSHKNAN